MKAARVAQLRKELKYYEKDELIELCLRVAKHKKTGKELLTYLLFESKNEDQYIQSLKMHIDEVFDGLDVRYSRPTKKKLRRLSRFVNSWTNYSKKKATEVEVRIHICRKIKETTVPRRLNFFMQRFYERQRKKIDKRLPKLHEDLQFDFEEMLEELDG